jgi:hypothetical protein
MRVQAILIGITLVGGLQAANIVDQSQLLENTSSLAVFSQAVLAQSFMPSFTTVSGAEVELGSTTATGNVTIGLYSSLGGTLLASGTATGVTGGEFAQVFWSPVTVVAGDTYYLEFSSATTTLNLAGDTSNPYAGGEAFANGSPPTAFPADDYTFQTYSSNTGGGGGGGGVPEPATFGGVLLGCAALGLLRKRLQA